MKTVKNTKGNDLMMKILTYVCAFSLIALGVVDVVLLIMGILLPRPLLYVTCGLAVANAMLAMRAKRIA